MRQITTRFLKDVKYCLLCKFFDGKASLFCRSENGKT